MLQPSKDPNRIGMVYARVSSKRQELEGSGLRSQEGRCIKELQSMGIPYERSFLDSYTGKGDFMKRPAMRALITYIESNPDKKFLVVFDDLKRFARDVQFHLRLRDLFRELDVELRCLNYHFDESEEGQFVETMFAASNELERKQNRRQVIQKQKARLEQGYWPFPGKKGYNLTKNKFHGTLAVPTEDAIEIFAPALEDFAKGGIVAKMDLCNYLVERGFWKKQKGEKYVSKLTELLKDPFICGDIEYLPWGVERRPGQHQPLISRETFELIQKRLRKEDSGIRVRQDISPDFPLRHLITCQSCGLHLTAGWSKGRSKRYAYYVCHNKDCSCYGKSSSRDAVENAFEKLLERSSLKDEVDQVVTTMFDRVWQDEIELTKKQKIAIQQKVDFLGSKIKQLTEFALVAKSEPARRAYEEQIEDVAREREALQDEMPIEIDFSIPYRTALDKALGLLKNPSKIWANLEVKERQGLFYFVFDQKLEYSLEDGYRTAETPIAIRIFADFATAKSDDVEMGGVEPPSS